jgi:hypothetical protein
MCKISEQRSGISGSRHHQGEDQQALTKEEKLKEKFQTITKEIEEAQKD